MSELNETPRANRLHIGIFGKRNAGKSSLINAITNQEIALVSEYPGTTTDPVYKSMEILPIGPCVIIDTAGIDDVGNLGIMRVKKTKEVLDKTDIALLVVDPEIQMQTFESDIISEAKKGNIPVIIVLTKMDIYTDYKKYDIKRGIDLPMVYVSSKNKKGIDKLKQCIIEHAPAEFQNKCIVGDILNSGDLCILVTPIDTAAPKGRLILPQVQTIRDILDYNAQALVVKETELKTALKSLSKKPRIVITDSQAFNQVNEILDEDIPLTSFSILYARYKGDLKTLVQGIKAVENLKAGDKVLIAEACTHHRQDDDIGTVKIPLFLNEKVQGKLEFEWCSGQGYPKNLKDFKLVIHCGACMLNRKQMLSRIAKVQEVKVPIVNYGVLLAYMNSMLDKVLKPFSNELE